METRRSVMIHTTTKQTEQTKRTILDGSRHKIRYPVWTTIVRLVPHREHWSPTRHLRVAVCLLEIVSHNTLNDENVEKLWGTSTRCMDTILIRPWVFRSEVPPQRFVYCLPPVPGSVYTRTVSRLRNNSDPFYRSFVRRSLTPRNCVLSVEVCTFHRIRVK